MVGPKLKSLWAFSISLSGMGEKFLLHHLTCSPSNEQNFATTSARQKTTRLWQNLSDNEQKRAKMTCFQQKMSINEQILAKREPNWAKNYVFDLCSHFNLFFSYFRPNLQSLNQSVLFAHASCISLLPQKSSKPETNFNSFEAEHRYQSKK